jgi:hypothetical protein
MLLHNWSDIILTPVDFPVQADAHEGSFHPVCSHSANRFAGARGFAVRYISAADML